MLVMVRVLGVKEEEVDGLVLRDVAWSMLANLPPGRAAATEVVAGGIAGLVEEMVVGREGSWEVRFAMALAILANLPPGRLAAFGAGTMLLVLGVLRVWGLVLGVLLLVGILLERRFAAAFAMLANLPPGRFAAVGAIFVSLDFVHK